MTTAQEEVNQGLTVLSSGKFVDLVKDNKTNWEYVKRKKQHSVVEVFPVTKEHEVIFVSQYRVPTKTHVLSFPAGLCGDEGVESEKDAAVRELYEEAGCVLTKDSIFNKVAVVFPSAGLSSESITCYLATDVQIVTSGGGVEGENIQVHKVPIDQVSSYIENSCANMSIATSVYAGIHFIQGYINIEKAKTKSSWLQRIRYNFQHRRAVLDVEKEFTGKNTFLTYLHDVDKLLMIILHFPHKWIKKIHRFWAWHHPENKIGWFRLKEAIFDWESGPRTKATKPMNAYETAFYLYPQYFDKTKELLIEWGQGPKSQPKTY